MSEAPQEVQIALAEFDRDQLSPSQRDLSGEAYREAVRDHLAGQFAGEGGAAHVVVTEDRIILRWTDSTEGQSLESLGVEQLKAGNWEKGVATLRIALERDPSSHEALFNLGMALSERGEMQEAVEVLEALLARYPGHAPGWVALGVAQARMKQEAAATASLLKAVELAPEDGHARKNLGALLARTGQLAAAIEHLKHAVVILPVDPQAWLNLAMALEEAGDSSEADKAYRQVMKIDPTGEMGKLAEEGRTRIAAASFRKRGGGYRADAMAYCLGALQRFQGMPRAEVQKIAFEIALLGSRGLDVNSPAEQYTLESIPGSFSGLHLLCIQYVGFQILNPSLDLGFDLSAEYQAALQMHQG